ncbi:ABC transporter ATP-binding protein [Anaerotalea alkaliphila]|uniref:sn-glycerol-3-phosphate ABC transporter ATP-binding protein UgpC n=1 Tax=Anaerotalea alkaliphila TaxID=2662126 RepID=A0A7X5KNT9_9FIRM|nr:sn-glycerol-3-phosphate ABC transporter ATP-binding protein UgpC [Anaerotalea alkaliphila]NDL67082.1 sn-glycerol-3-phosphate ABC transporter ATP-binding protein UgpC [Anaerotalea alkaliphila]
MAEVVLKSVEKQYPNGFKAVHGIDLEIKDGEFMVFVGPSGCAKSTTLRMVAGLEDITGGEIWIGDKCVNEVQPKDRGIAMVFQNYALYPHMTAYNNMAFGLQMSKTPKNIIDQRVREAAKHLEIEDLLDRKPKEMSGGQRQRVALGRALVRKPDVFLFDEPLSNLDAKLRVSMRVRIQELHEMLKAEGVPATMIYVTHDQVEAMTMGDRITVLNAGRIMQVDTPMNLYRKPENLFVAGFIGAPSMNLVDGEIVEMGGKVFVSIPGGVLPLPEEKAEKVRSHVGKKIKFGLRPEDIIANEVHEGGEGFVTGSVRVVEQMGNEEFIYFNAAGTQFIARVNPEQVKNIRKGEDYRFWFNLAKCHMFDLETEENLTL